MSELEDARATVDPKAVEDLVRRIAEGERRALARGITLVESTRTDDQAMAEALLAAALPYTGRSIRLGLSGAPGVGKSTFIEAFGTHLTPRGHKVAVLAVDPTSSRSGGSILGDKTRMEALARDPNAFIRPSPSGGTLGGVARRTREAVLLVEAAGFDVVIVETVGVGQSEVAVADMVDMFVLLVSPGGGDELQGIKRGIMELADLVVITKADGDLEKAAGRAASEHAAAVHLLRPRTRTWAPEVVLTSSVTGKGLEDVWDAIERYRRALDESGELADMRANQARSWMWSEIEQGLIDSLRANSVVSEELPRLEARVRAGEVTPLDAARHVLRLFARGEQA